MAELIPQVHKGFVMAVSAPSGTGKTSLCDKLAEELPYITRSVSVTTRPKREGEISGADYTFVEVDEFKKRQDSGQLLETAEVFGNWYGTPKSPVDSAIKDGKIMVMDIDTVGAFAVKEILGDDCVLVFIMPPSLAELESRLIGRGKDEPEVLKKRLMEAEREMGEASKYEYIISNNMFDQAYEELKGVVLAERARPNRLSL